MSARTLVAGAALAWLLTGPAFAQPTGDPIGTVRPAPGASALIPSITVDPTAAAARADTGVALAAAEPGSRALFRTGVAVRDSTGARLGRIVQVIRGPEGRTSSVVVDVDGVPVHLSANTLTPRGGHLVADRTRDALLARAANP